jgi:hypothetical protein
MTRALDHLDSLSSSLLSKLHTRLLNPSLKFNFNKEILFTLIMEARSREQIQVAWEFNTLRQPMQNITSKENLRKQDRSQITIILAFITAHQPKIALQTINLIAPNSQTLAKVFFKTAFYGKKDHR